MRFLYVALFVLVFIADRVAKCLAISKKISNYKVTSFLSLDLHFNRGVSWGIFDSQSSLVFSAISILVCFITIGLIIFAYIRFKEGHTIVGEVLAISGSISNIIDRLLYGGVVDFVSCYYGPLYWPVFNLADVFIVVGIFLILYNVITGR